MSDCDVSRTLLLTIDAVRADHLSQYGYKRDTMPVMDRLDNHGVRYESAFANGTNTGISLPSMLSSQYQGTSPCIQGPTVASVLQDAGFQTAGFHSNTLFANTIGRPNGFDHFQDFGVLEEQKESDNLTITQQIYTKSADKIKPILEKLNIKSVAKRARNKLLPAESLHSMSYYVNGEKLSDAVIEWLQNYYEDPFFLWIHYLDPHRPYGIDLADPVYGDPIEEKKVQELMAKAGTSPSSMTDMDRKRMIDLYDSDLRYTSDAISRVFDELEELNIWNDTAVVCTSDHGEEFGEHGNYFHRNRPYDELIHVPLFVKAADYAREVISEPKELIDITPSICDIMNVEGHPSFEGIRLNNTDGRQIYATGAFAESGPVVAGRWNGWKYIATDTQEELYNLQSDPTEQKDVAHKHPNIVSRYRNSIPNHLFEDSHESIDKTDNKTVEKRLRGLGYLE